MATLQMAAQTSLQQPCGWSKHQSPSGLLALAEPFRAIVHSSRQSPTAAAERYHACTCVQLTKSEQASVCRTLMASVASATISELMPRVVAFCMAAWNAPCVLPAPCTTNLTSQQIKYSRKGVQSAVAHPAGSPDVSWYIQLRSYSGSITCMNVGIAPDFAAFASCTDS